MATLAWNIKLLGNLTARDFETWRVDAKIPAVYHFNVTSQDANREQSYWDTERQEATSIVPGGDNTIIISGNEGVVEFEPYCYAGNRCVMMSHKDCFRTGTDLFALILTSDGLLDPSVLNKLMDTVDLGTWIKKHQPDALDAYNHRTDLIAPDGFIDDSTPDGEKLKNAVCQYVVKVLELGTTPKQP